MTMGACGLVMSRTRRMATAARAAPAAEEMAADRAVSVTAWLAGLKAKRSTLLSTKAISTIGRGEGVGELGSGARKEAVEVPEEVDVVEEVPEAEAVAEPVLVPEEVDVAEEVPEAEAVAE